MENKNDTPAKKESRGRKKTGKSRSEILQQAKDKYVKKQLESGKTRLITFIQEDTKENLEKLITVMDLKTQGDVIDSLVYEQVKRMKL